MSFIRILTLLLCLLSMSTFGSMAEAAGEQASAEFERGPQRGRLLRDGDFALEVTIFETGVPPQFRLYAYRNNVPLPANEVSATIELGRLGGKVDRIAFSPQGEFLLGDATIVEPHSFDVSVVATADGKEHRWDYASYEGRTTIHADAAAAAGLVVEKTGPATIHKVVRLMGRVGIDPNRVARVRARYPGAVLAVHANLGEPVARGQVLAEIEAHESMQSYSVSAPVNGILIKRTNAGDVAGDEPLFEITDLSEVIVDLNVFATDLDHLRPGLSVTIRSVVGDVSAEAKLERLLPVVVASSQSAVARVRLANLDGNWRPGLMVNAELVVSEHAVPLAVRTIGLQRFRDFDVVFARVGDTYEVRMLELGRRDGDYIEVLGGIEAGVDYVTEQSFLIRADIEKSGASHDH